MILETYNEFKITPACPASPAGERRGRAVTCNSMICLQIKFYPQFSYLI